MDDIANNYKLNKTVINNTDVRKSFNSLSERIFDLSFENWYNGGYWTDKYIPYVLLDGQKVVSNVSVNIIDTIWQNQPKRYIQLGTVMTDIEYRNKGLARYLIEIILEEWQSKCDAIYLFANNTVLEFYLKFGFQKETEYQYTIPIIGQKQNGSFKKLDMSNNTDRKFLKTYYEKSNPFSVLPMINNYGLLMFYCSEFMKDYIYYCEDFDAVIIAMKKEKNLICFDIYYDGNKTMFDILLAIADKEINNIILGFTPKDTSTSIINSIDEEDTLFVLDGKENIFINNKLMFPVLSHA